MIHPTRRFPVSTPLKRLRRAVLAAGLLAGGLAAAVAQSSTLSKDDQEFLQSAYQGGLYEIQIGQYAAASAGDPKVKAFGQQMATDHAALNQKVADLAQKKGLTLDTQPNALNETKIKAATVLSGGAFDQTYVPLMIQAHKNDIQAFEKEEAATADADIKAAIQGALPTLRHHLHMIRQVKASESGASS